MNCGLMMDEKLGANTTTSHIEYPFVSHQMKNYDELKEQLEILEEIIDKSSWRDDMRFLYYLTWLDSLRKEAIFLS